MMRRPLFRLTPLALAVLLSGCAVGPDYLRPANWLPAAFKEAPTAVAETKTDNPAIVQQWWTLFNDTTLNELVDLALRQNADLRSAVARVEQADAAAREAGASLFPNVDAQAAGSNTHLSEKTATWSVNSPEVLRARSAGLSLSYELDVWGRVRRSNEAARASLLASQYGRDSIRLSVAGLVAANYLNLRALDAQLAITAESLSSREESAKLVKTRVDAGLVSPLDQYQADGALAALQAQQAELRRSRALLAHQLALLTGKPDLEVAAGPLSAIPLPPQPPAGLPADLIEARPDVRQAEQQLIAANANIGVAKAAYYPKFSLTGVLGSESKTLSDLFSSGAGTWSAGLSLLMPIFDFGKTGARVDQAKALNQQSLIAWQKTLETAYKEVRDALASLNELGTAESAQENRADNARKALDLARLRYDAGYSGYLEVLDAQRSANEAQLAAIATRQARLNAAVDLFKALGGGWRAAS
ncbi:efflux transporter outer membrane subunit [Azonexus hydrophilus]|uniref:efflux transporter outer membrane subunit n=1 Tax=Azonexus hydrophilus TaxID=418702 RepID=UPI00040A2FAA|nr:efflux transporter outer membrane subunit [Azonexus hydrophilus]